VAVGSLGFYVAMDESARSTDRQWKLGASSAVVTGACRDIDGWRVIGFFAGFFIRTTATITEPFEMDRAVGAGANVDLRTSA